MNHAGGIRLHQKWPYMSGDQKVRCIDAIYRKLGQMADINFPAYGSLYFSTTPLEPLSRLPLDEGFCVGPHCGTRYWSCGDHRYYQHTVPNHGPCKFFLSIIENIITKIWGYRADDRCILRWSRRCRPFEDSAERLSTPISAALSRLSTDAFGPSQAGSRSATCNVR